MDSVHEEWRPVKGSEGKYEVSDQGRVRVLPHEVRHWCGRMIPKPGRLLSQSRHSGGYLLVSIEGKKHYVHKLVMEAFAGPANGKDVNHIDGDKTCNRRTNLEYCDRLHNVRHAVATGLQDNSGEGNGMHKLTADEVLAIRTCLARGLKHGRIARTFGVSSSCIGLIAQGKRWQHVQLSA